MIDLTSAGVRLLCVIASGFLLSSTASQASTVGGARVSLIPTDPAHYNSIASIRDFPPELRLLCGGYGVRIADVNEDWNPYDYGEGPGAKLTWALRAGNLFVLQCGHGGYATYFENLAVQWDADSGKYRVIAFADGHSGPRQTLATLAANGGKHPFASNASNYRKISSVRKLPPTVVRVCADENGRLASAGAPWEPTDDIADPKLPRSRLVWAAEAHDQYVLECERGGYVHSYEVHAVEAKPSWGRALNVAGARAEGRITFDQAIQVLGLIEQR